MLSRKGGTAVAIFAVALLVAILVSVVSVVSYVNLQTDALSKLKGTGETFLLMSRGSASLADSRVSAELIQILSEDDSVTNVLPQKIFAATMITTSNSYTVFARAVNTSSFFQVRHAYVNGTFAEGMRVNAGEILARVASVSKGDVISIALEDKIVDVEVAGIVQTRTQSDTELIMPVEVADLLTGEEGEVSVVEFAVESNATREIQSISHLLPADVKIVATQQTQTLIRDMNNQTLYFLNLWSIPIYVVVTATAYMIATRLIIESSYELTMLKMLGAKRSLIFKLVILVTFTITLIGTVLGIAIGLGGAQIISTAIHWIWKGVSVVPFLEAQQAAQIFLFALASSLFGCIYPSVKAARKTYAEKQL